MKILLIDFDSDWPNLALMRLARHHRLRGDKVALRRSRGRYPSIQRILHSKPDRVYLSKIFTFQKETREKRPLDEWFRVSRSVGIEMETGGTGIDESISLPDEVDHLFPDYSIYRDPPYAIGFITRGCIRNCEWCIVPSKEGRIHHCQNLEGFVPEAVDRVVLLDNNFLAWEGSIGYIEEVMIPSNKAFYMTQGFDIRLFTEENIDTIMRCRWMGKHFKKRELVFGFDSIGIYDTVAEKLQMFRDHGYSTSSLKFLMLYDFNTTLSEDLRRLDLLRRFGAQPFWMRYRQVNGVARKNVGYVDCRIEEFPGDIFGFRGCRLNISQFLRYLTDRGVRIPERHFPRMRKERFDIYFGPTIRRQKRMGGFGSIPGTFRDASLWKWAETAILT